MADVCLVRQIFNAQRFEVDMAQFRRRWRSSGIEKLAAFDAAQPSKQAEAARAPG